jgi:ATP-dependent RNA helicase DeaD
MTATTETTAPGFDTLGLIPPLLKALADVGYETPSPIQAACIPVLLGGHDLLGEAQTGTGKTAAFALPMLQMIDVSMAKPQALILTPTRELAIQVAEALQKYAHHLPGFHVLPIYGGQSMVIQLRQLSRGAHVIVGTPGRVMDHLERKSMVLDKLKMLVLDEADEMLRMGFIDDVKWILEHTPSSRQTALFSATMPDVIRRVAREHLREPKEIKIKSATSTVAAITQAYIQTHAGNKLEALTRVLEVEDDFDAALIFVRTKTATVEIADKLEARGYAVAALNGDLTQGLREQVIERLKNGNLDIVVATDVAARGLDVARVSHVINYDVPYDTEAYVHRIGRTGRAGRAGRAILFITPREIHMLKTIERATRQKIEALTIPTMGEVANRRVAQFTQQILDVLKEEKLDFFFDVVRRIESEHEIAAREIAAALAWLAQRDRPLQLGGPAQVEMASPPPVREVRNERDDTRPAPSRSTSEERGERPPRASREDVLAKRRAFTEGALQRYRIEIGRNQGVMPKEIVGAIANEGGIDGKNIGQINLFDDYSTVELPPNLPADLMDVLKRLRVRQFALKTRPVEPGEVEEARPPRPKSSKPTGTLRKSFDAPKKPFDGPKKSFDSPWKTEDRPKKPYDPARKSFDGPKKPYDPTRKPAGGPRGKPSR